MMVVLLYLSNTCHILKLNNMLYLDKTHKTATKNHDISELKLFFAKMKKKTLMYLRLLKTH